MKHSDQMEGEGEAVLPVQEASMHRFRPQERYMQISGSDRNGRTKCEIFLRHYLHYSDGTMKEVEELHIRKPIVNIFSAAGYVNVFLDFMRRTDEDLRLAFEMVKRYMDTSSGVSFFPEEVESGKYLNEQGAEELVFYPVLEIAISPLGHETEYMIHGWRPLLYSLVGPSPEKDLTILQLVFKNNLFVVNEQVGPVDFNALRQEAMNEAQMEGMNAFLDDPEDY